MTERRNVSKRDIAIGYYDQIIHELEFCAQGVEFVETGKQAARWLRARINKLLEEKAKCRLK